MHIEFQQRLDKIDSQALPDFLPEEIDSILNRAILRFVEQRYTGTGTSRRPYEFNQKQTEDVRTLVRTQTQQPVVDTLEPEVWTVDLSAFTPSYMIYVRSRMEVESEECGTKLVYPLLVQQDDVEPAKRDPFNKPTFDYPIGYFEDNRLKLLTAQDTTVNNVWMTYLKYPEIVDITANPKVSSDLPEHTHDEVVELATKIALHEIESPRIQAHQAIYQTTE